MFLSAGWTMIFFIVQRENVFHVPIYATGAWHLHSSFINPSCVFNWGSHAKYLLHYVHQPIKVHCNWVLQGHWSSISFSYVSLSIISFLSYCTLASFFCSMYTVWVMRFFFCMHGICKVKWQLCSIQQFEACIGAYSVYVAQFLQYIQCMYFTT